MKPDIFKQFILPKPRVFPSLHLLNSLFYFYIPHSEFSIPHLEGALRYFEVAHARSCIS